MKLTNEQIEYVSNYIESKDIKWYELQVELTDHMVSSMEEFWEQNPDLSFEQVQENTFKKFTKPELKAIEKQRTKILGKEVRQAQYKLVDEYLKFPKIFVSLVLVFIAFKISFHFDKPHKYLTLLLTSSIVFYVPIIYYGFKNKKIDSKRFLAIELGTPIFPMLLFPTLIINLVGQLKQELLTYPLLVLLFCFLWMFGNLFLMTGLFLQKYTISNVKKQYQLT